MSHLLLSASPRLRGYFFASLTLQLAVLIMLAQLPGLISRNNQNRMHSLIDSIGESH